MSFCSGSDPLRQVNGISGLQTGQTAFHRAPIPGPDGYFGDGSCRYSILLKREFIHGMVIDHFGASVSSFIPTFQGVFFFILISHLFSD